ncbi:MAG: Rieske 2Fe-2S domain-containing protein [Betaproteobacteria bacterium]|nr:Rieske 2Fe-2S domain-containing protein [Betaproteobacteria bacterium]
MSEQSVTPGERPICRSGELADSGDGVRFEVRWQGQAAQAFAVRFRGAVRAYLNRCGHLPMELDWIPGKFFDGEGALLICSTHGALYEPGSGRCAGGPCADGLVPLAVEERQGMVYLKE